MSLRPPAEAQQPGLRDGSSGTARRPGLILSIFVGLTTAAIVAQTVWAIRQDRELTLAAEAANGRTTARLLEEHASQQLAVAAARLDAIAVLVAGLDSSPGADVDAAESLARTEARIRGLVEDQLSTSRSAGALQYVNLQGQRWASPVDFPAFAAPGELRDFIPELLQHPERKSLLIGKRFERLIDSEVVLPLARNLYDAQGRHLGLISTELTIAYFKSFYASVARNSQATVQMITSTGQVVASAPSLSSAAPAAVQAGLDRIQAGPEEGSFEDNSLLGDGRPRLLSYRKLPAQPLVIVFGRDMPLVLGTWQDRAHDRLLFSGVFIALHLLLTYYLLLHMKRLQGSEQRLRDSEAKFVALFQHAPIPLALMDAGQHRLIEVNEAMLRLFDVSRAGWIGASPLDPRHWLDPERRERYARDLQQQGQVDSLEAELRRINGTLFTALISTRLLQSGGQALGIVSVIDVSLQRKIEREMGELNAQLEGRVQQRTQHLEEALNTVKNMQSELVRAEKMAALGSLVAGIAHELNTPIGNGVTVASSIQAYADSLSAELGVERPRRSRMELLIGSIQSGADILVRSLDRAASLITSFKHVAVDQSSDQRRPFDLRHVLQELALMLEPMYLKQHRLELDLAPDLEMDSYPGALTQVLTNLVSNAVSHAFAPGSSGLMRLSSRALDGDRLEICFSDDGAGITAEHLNHVFEPFFTTKLGQGGSGLGLSIVYNLVTGVLGGNIAIDSAPGQGTRLRLLLPRQAPVK